MIIDGADSYTSKSFSNKNRLMRLLWIIVWNIFFRFSFRPMYKWRNFLLKLFGAKIGKYVHINRTTRIWAPWNIYIGNYVGIGENVILYSMDLIKIYDYSVISQGAHLCCGSHNFNTKNFQLVAAPIIIKSRVWLCADSFVGPGVTIEEGSVIGARGVVTKSVITPWKVWAGVPVAQIGSRNILD